MNDPESLHAFLSILKSQDRPFTLLELADHLSLTPEEAKVICNELIEMELVDLEPLPMSFGQRELNFGFALTCQGRWFFGQKVDRRPMMERVHMPKP